MAEAPVRRRLTDSFGNGVSKALSGNFIMRDGKISTASAPLDLLRQNAMDF